MTTFYDIIYKIKAALEADPRVNTVSYGTIDLQALDKHTNYSLSHFNIVNTSYTSNMIEITINLLCMDILSIEKDPDWSKFERKDNTYDVLNTQYSIMNRLFSMFDRGEFVDEQFKLSGEPIAEPFMVRFNDHVAGWEADFVIQVPNNMSICDEVIEERFNLEIGGLGFSIKTAEELETLMQLTPGFITDFELKGNDIHAKMSGNYVIENETFRDQYDIKTFLDHGGLCTSIGNNAFRGVCAFHEIQAVNVEYVGSFGFYQTGATQLVFPNLTSTGNFAFAQNRGLNFVYIPMIELRIGTSESDNGCFQNARQGITVVSSVATQTNWAGNPDGDLQYVTDTLNGTVTYV